MQLGIIFAVVMIVILVVATRPSTFRVERTAIIPASPSTVFSYVDDLRRWTSWSPWETIDPNLQRNYSGSRSGKGAVYEWSGNKKAGQGRMTILDSVPAERVLIDLNFIKPFKAQNTAEFTFKPAGANTHVTWAMYGPTSAVGKVMSLFGGMDKFLGNDFEKGLGNLEAVVRSDAEGKGLGALKEEARG